MSSTIMRVFDTARATGANDLVDRALEIYNDDLAHQDEQYKELVTLRSKVQVIQSAIDALIGPTNRAANVSTCRKHNVKRINNALEIQTRENN